jgi:phosphoserine phosphatase RsbU/P
MPPQPMPRVLLIGDPIPDDARLPLEAAGFPVAVAGYTGIDPAEAARSHIVILDVTPQTTIMAQSLCRRWRIELGENYVPIVWLCFEPLPALLTGALDSGADVCIPRPINASYLLAQVKALLRVQYMYGRLAGRAAESQQINQRLQSAYQQIDSDLEMARRIHRGFLPRTLPEVHQVRLTVCYRPRSRIGGDFYDVIRLDEEHIAIYIADAMGKGLPASSLLSIFVKKSLRVKEITGRSYRLVPPNEVLSTLNRDLVSLGMPEPPFITMLYLQVNCRDGTMTFSRASHPAPLYVPASGPVEYWPANGALLGVFDADYPVQVRQLKPGDKLVLYSDGVNPVESATPGNDVLLETITKYREEPLTALIDQTSRDLLEQSRNTEDFTILGMEYR